MLENRSSGLLARMARARRFAREEVVLGSCTADSALRGKDWHCSLRWRSGGKGWGLGNSGNR